RPEIIGLVAIGTAYGAAVLTWAPDFFRISLPMIRLAYGATGAPHFVDLFRAPVWIALLIAALIAVQRQPKADERTPIASALLIAAAGFGAAYFIQAKGWTYHAIPLLGCASLALASLVAETAQPPARLRVLGLALLV